MRLTFHITGLDERTALACLRAAKVLPCADWREKAVDMRFAGHAPEHIASVLGVSLEALERNRQETSSFAVGSTITYANLMRKGPQCTWCGVTTHGLPKGYEGPTARDLARQILPSDPWADEYNDLHFNLRHRRKMEANGEL